MGYNWDAQALTAGEPTVPRLLCTNGSLGLGSSGTVKFSYFTAAKSETITAVRYLVGTAAGATPTLSRVGIYAVDGAGGLTLVASTANDTAAFTTGLAAVTKTLSASLTKAAGRRYAVGLLNVTGAGAPTFVGAMTNPNSMGSESNQAPALSNALTGQTDLPASVAAASLSVSAGLIYAVLVP